ncbi:14535_t:CDS:1 [Dentiscutata erythropus]|uniref:14535_t:CDS:1 n=1 Tax=Dentiscutata erythropus TaxID=1348616 RepID=A0A9N9IW19_9GLOM|nr:14535_t:CDS:1 [Dentiscutata erythropus]
MNRNLALFFAFLAVFSIVNAIPHQMIKRETKFLQCPSQYVRKNTVTIDQVTIDPDPPVSNQAITIKGHVNTTENIVKGDIFLFGFSDVNFKLLGGNRTGICSDGKTKCPTEYYVIDFSITAPKLPDIYFIAAGIV